MRGCRWKAHTNPEACEMTIKPQPPSSRSSVSIKAWFISSDITVSTSVAPNTNQAAALDPRVTVCRNSVFLTLKPPLYFVSFIQISVRVTAVFLGFTHEVTVTVLYLTCCSLLFLCSSMLRASSASSLELVLLISSSFLQGETQAVNWVSQSMKFSGNQWLSSLKSTQNSSGKHKWHKV